MTAIWDSSDRLASREGESKESRSEKNPVNCGTAPSPHHREWSPAPPTSSPLTVTTETPWYREPHRAAGVVSPGWSFTWLGGSDVKNRPTMGREGWQNQAGCLSSGLDYRAIGLAYKWSRKSQVQEYRLSRWSLAVKWQKPSPGTHHSELARFIATNYLLTELVPSTGLLAPIKGLWWLPQSNPRKKNRDQ